MRSRPATRSDNYWDAITSTTCWYSSVLISSSIFGSLRFRTFHQMEEPPRSRIRPKIWHPRFRAQWFRQQQALRHAFIRQQEAIQRNAIRARQEVLNRIAAKRGALPEWWAAQERLTATVLDELGITWKPRMARSVFSNATATLNGTLVQANGNQALSPNYIESLLALRDLAKEKWFQGDTFEQPAPHTLLHLLLRHSMLLEYALAASHLLSQTQSC